MTKEFSSWRRFILLQTRAHYSYLGIKNTFSRWTQLRIVVNWCSLHEIFIFSLMRKKHHQKLQSYSSLTFSVPSLKAAHSSQFVSSGYTNQKTQLNLIIRCDDLSFSLLVLVLDPLHTSHVRLAIWNKEIFTVVMKCLTECNLLQDLKIWFLRRQDKRLIPLSCSSHRSSSSKGLTGWVEWRNYIVGKIWGRKMNVSIKPFSMFSMHVWICY